MFPKTFLSYKYSEACRFRDTICRLLGKSYCGETDASPDFSGSTPRKIIFHLERLIAPSEVVIVAVSPGIGKSQWMLWELMYALGGNRRGGTRKPKGIVAVIVDGFEQQMTNALHMTEEFSYIHRAIIANRHNYIGRKTKVYEEGASGELVDSYISLVNEQEFLHHPGLYLDNAQAKAARVGDYRLAKSMFC